MEQFKERVDAWFPKMVEWRRYLHENPELSFQEAETAQFVKERLEDFGLEVRSSVGGHGVIGVLRGGRPGPVVALRADMDALPIQDAKTCAYASKKEGVMHACGHDAHTAELLAVAGILSERKSELAGTVKFLFQPAEEISPGGAKPMIEDGALDGVDVIYGIHLLSTYPAGQVLTRRGPIMAAADEFVIDLQGVGGHGGMPHNTVDSVMVGAHLAVNLQTIVSRNVNPTKPAVVSVGSLKAGEGFNVIADSCRLIGTVRTFETEVRDQIRRRIEEITIHTSAMFGAKHKVDYKIGYPPVINHDREADRVMRVAKQTFGEQRVFEIPLMMPGEDFAYYLQKKPGAFMIVGAGNTEKGIVHQHHHPQFDIDEESMKTAALLFISLYLDYTADTQAV